MHWEQFPLPHICALFPKLGSSLCDSKRTFSPYTISSFNKYRLPKFIIRLPFDFSNQLFCHESLVFLHMTHICDTLIFSYIPEVMRMYKDTPFSASISPKDPIYSIKYPKAPVFRDIFWGNHPKTPSFYSSPLSEYSGFMSASHTI